MDELFIQPLTPEWIYVSFRIQLLLAHPNIKILSLRKRTPLFATNYDNFLKIEAAVDITDMDAPSISSIKSSLKKDLVLRTGKLPQPADSTQNNPKRYRLLFMKMALLQILPTLREPSLTSEDLLAQHPQYDSVYLSPRQPELAIFTHEYLVRDPQQYQWEYEVEYSYDEFKEWNPDEVMCENCKQTAAKFYCVEDKEVYCWPCFGDLHRTERKAKHRKQPLTPYNCPPECQKSLHQNERLTHYCFECKQLKCSICLADGLHGTGESSQGVKLHEFMDSRELSTLFMENEAGKTSQAKIKIGALIREIEDKIQLISRHYDLRVKEYARWFEQKTAAMREWAVVQLNGAAGLHSELKRKYDEVLWLQNFSLDMKERSTADRGMLINEGINLYMTRAFTQEYFQRIERRMQELKIFS